MIELEVAGIRLASPDDTPVLLLQEMSGSRVIPIWISSVDAAAIAIVLDEGDAPQRPLTHDLVVKLLDMVVTSPGHVEITEMIDGVFHANLVSGDIQLDVRPSDGIAVALRMGWKLTCTETLMDQVGVEVDEDESDEVEKFKEFLDNVNPDDFENDESP